MYSKSSSSRNTSGSNRQTNLARYQELADHDEDKGEHHRNSFESIIADSPLYSSSSNQMIDPTMSSAHMDYSSTPISSVHKTQQQQPQQQQKANHLSRLRPSGIFDDESPTSVLDLNTSKLWQQHLNRLLDASSGDLEKLVLVPDNARSLPPSCHSTPKRAARPLISKALALSSKQRPNRWNSEPSSTDSDPSISLTTPMLSASSSSPRLPPPPFLGTSPIACYPRPVSVFSSSDTQPVLPSRSQLDVSEHCELPDIRARPRRNRGHRLRRHTSDSVLERPERKDSESGEDTSEELGLMVR